MDTPGSTLEKVAGTAFRLFIVSPKIQSLKAVPLFEISLLNFLCFNFPAALI